MNPDTLYLKNQDFNTQFKKYNKKEQL